MEKYFRIQRNLTIWQKLLKLYNEKGVFKPLQRVDLKEGERVRIEIKKETLLEKLKRYRVKVDEDILEKFLRGEDNDNNRYLNFCRSCI